MITLFVITLSRAVFENEKVKSHQRKGVIMRHEDWVKSHQRKGGVMRHKDSVLCSRKNAAFYDNQGVLRTLSNPDPNLYVIIYDWHVQRDILKSTKGNSIQLETKIEIHLIIINM